MNWKPTSRPTRMHITSTAAGHAGHEMSPRKATSAGAETKSVVGERRRSTSRSNCDLMQETVAFKVALRAARILPGFAR
jgi:hypothetical protein